MDNLLLAYLAGAIDSDGFITIKRKTYNIRVVKDSQNPSYAEWTGIKQTDPTIINLIHEHFGGYKAKEKSQSKNGKPLYSVRLMSKKAHHFIAAIYPFLRIKKRQAEIVLQLRECINQKRTKTVLDGQKYKRASLSDEQVAQRESLLVEVRSLNDVRHGPAHSPIPWQNIE